MLQDIPSLLMLWELKKKSPKKIDKNADYILAVKANQPQLLAHIEDEF